MPLVHDDRLESGGGILEVRIGQEHGKALGCRYETGWKAFSLPGFVRPARIPSASLDRPWQVHFFTKLKK